MKKLLILSALALGMFSCSDDGRLNGDILTGDKIAGFQNAAITASYFADEGPVTMDIPVTLIGLGNGQVSDSDIVLNYAIDNVNSSAVSGVEYTLPATGQVTIPAGSEFGILPITVNTGSFDPEVSTKVVITLTSATEGVVIGEQYKSVTFNFVGCLADLEGTWSVSVLREANNTTFSIPLETVTQTAINEFNGSSTGTFTPGQAPDMGFEFTVLCGTVEIPDQGLFMGAFGNRLEGVALEEGPGEGQHGYVSADGNTMVIRYRAEASANSFLYFTSTYTRN